MAYFYLEPGSDLDNLTGTRAESGSPPSVILTLAQFTGRDPGAVRLAHRRFRRLYFAMGEKAAAGTAGKGTCAGCTEKGMGRHALEELIGDDLPPKLTSAFSLPAMPQTQTDGGGSGR